jgi:hypothetical protein
LDSRALWLFSLRTNVTSSVVSAGVAPAAFTPGSAGSADFDATTEVAELVAADADVTPIAAGTSAATVTARPVMARRRPSRT